MYHVLRKAQAAARVVLMLAMCSRIRALEAARVGVGRGVAAKPGLMLGAMLCSVEGTLPVHNTSTILAHNANFGSFSESLRAARASRRRFSAMVTVSAR